jgi:aspartyl-tRNA(Asn)/glutamyl-tRNA(Gln) amidotransferase subunit A
MNALTQLTVADMRQGLLSKEFSSEELAKAHIEHISRTNPVYNSFVCVSEAEALEAARNCDKVIAEQAESSHPLCGIPIAIKDMIVTKDIETTCASKILSGFIPPYDSTVVNKLKTAGAVILGKTNQDEFAMGSSSEHSAYGAVKNAWDTSRVAGGSSGGSAVAVAAYQAPLALGTDTGGSVRQPACFNGVIGIKPTYGRVSRYGVVAYASSCDQVGPFARSAKDLAQILETISGFDENDSTSMNVEVPSFSTEVDQVACLKGKRIGVPSDFLKEGLQSEVKEEFDKTLSQLKSLGAEIVEIQLPNIEYALASYYIIVCAEASSNLSRYDGVRYGHRAEGVGSLGEMYSKTRAEGFGLEVKRRIMMGTFALSTGYYDDYYKKAQQVRTLLIQDFQNAFKSCDCIATPTSPSTAFRIGEKMESPLEMYLADIFTVPANLTGIPGISIPVGLDANNVPIGLQLLAPNWQESLLLQFAHLLSTENGFDNSAIELQQS